MSYAYSVAIKLSLANLASAGLKLFERDLLGANLAATKLEDKLKALKMIAVGYGLEKAGSTIFGFLEKSIDASKEYTSQLSLMNAAGMSQRDIALSTAAAWQTSRDVLTSTAADNLKAIRELRSVFGVDHMDEAYKILPTVQRISAIQEALTGKKQENVGFDVVKAIELRTPGVMTQEALNRNAELMSRSIMGMGGTINVNDFHMALKQLKTQAFGFDDEFVYDYLPTFIQEAKTKGGSGSSAATALRTMMNTLIGGIGITKASIPLWLESGLIKPSDVVKNATGQFQLKPGAMKDSLLLQADPVKWGEKDGGAFTTVAKKHNLSLLQTVMAKAKNTNTQWAIYTILTKQAQFERDKKLIEGGGTSIETYQKLMKTNPELAQQALAAQWQNLLSIIGFQILPRLIPYMIKFADGLDHVSQWMEKHPDLTQDLVIGLVALAGTLTVLGTVLMTAGVVSLLGGIGPVIATVAGGLGVVAASLAGIGVAAAAFIAIYETVKYLNEKDQEAHPNQRWVSGGFSGKGGTGKRGHWEYDPTNPFGFDAFAKPLFRNPLDKGDNSYVFPRAAAPIHVLVHVHNKIDKQGLATMVTTEQTKSAAGPRTSVNFMDDQRSLIPAGGIGY